MKKFFTRLSLVIIGLLVGISAYGQVEIGSTSYARLSLAFNAINAGTHTGDIVVKITNNFTETTTAVLLPSGNGSADYSSVTIYPTDTYTIQGNLSTGIIQLQGADYVTIDGRKNMSGSNRDLTIKNNSTGGPCVRIDSLLTASDPANYNKVLYCNLEGSAKNNSNVWGVSLGASNSVTGAASSTGNEIGYNSFKFMYGGVRANSLSGRTHIGVKIYNNYFGSSNLAQSVSYQPIYFWYTTDAEVYDNTFEYIDYTSAIYVMYLYYSSGIKVYNNTIKNITGVSSLYSIFIQQSPNAKVYGNTIDNVRTGNGLNYPIYCATCSAGEIYDNTVNNVGGTSTFYGVYLSSAASGKILNNKITNVTNNSTTYGVFVSSAQYVQIKDNVIDNLWATANTTTYPYYMSSCANMEFINNRAVNITSGATIYGAYATSSATSKFHNNYFDNFISNGSSTTGAAGFYILSSNNSEIVNNSVSRMISTQWSTSGTTTNPFGILISSGTGYKIYYNSVNLTGKQLPSGTQGTLSACLILSGTAVNSFDLRNNNFYNDLEGLSGSRSFAVYLAGTGNLTSSTMDYNNYYVGGPYGHIGFLSSNSTTLAAWKSATSREGNSMNIFTDFNSVNVLAPYIGSALLGKGTPISGFQTDIIGVTRSGTNPTPGAYEEADDIVGPEIVFQKLMTTTNWGNRTVIANITDKTGVDVSGSAPRLYYRKASTDNTYNGNTSSTSGWKYSDATALGGNQFSFTVDYGKLQGGAGEGDEIQYFIIAQDIAAKKNISTTSGIFNQYPNTTNLTTSNFPVNNADSYRLAVGFSGNYSIGTNQTYTSLTKPDGIFQALMNNVIEGDVYLNISSNLTETGEVGLTSLTYDEGGPYTIYIRPNSTTKRSIQGEVAGALIKIIGVNNVVIDGSYEGKGRYLKFTNTAENTLTQFRATILVGSGMGRGGRDLTIKNCEISNGNRLNTSFGIITSDGTISTSTNSPSMNNLLIQNNHIYNSTYGMYIAGQTTVGTTTMNNLIVEDNIVGDDNLSNSILSYGIEVRYAPNGQIRRNKIYNFNGGPNNTNYIIGIQLFMVGSIPTYIDGNTIHSLNYQGTSICFANGIYVSGSYAVIQNNKISDILTTAYISYYPTDYSAAGIRLAGSFTKVWHNSIIMTGEMKYYTSSINYGGFAANVVFTSSYSGNDFRGNIFHNSVFKASSSVSHPEAYNIFFQGTSSPVGPYFTALDNNVYSIGNTAKVGGYDNWTYYLPFTYVAYNFSQWRSHTGRDANSKEGMPVFVSNKDDLHINGSSIGNSYFMYNRMPEVLHDGDGEMRNATTYYGADEVNAIFEIAEDTKIVPSNAVQCVEDVVTISANPDVTGFGDGVERSGLSSIDINWYKNGQLIPGAKSKSITFNPVKMSDSARYFATGTFMGKTVTSTETLLKVETPMTITYQPPTSDVCTTSPELTLLAEATGTILGYQWEFMKAGTSNWLDVPNANSNIMTRVITDELVGRYRLRVMGPGNCGPATIWTEAAMVTRSEPLQNVNLHQIEKSAGKELASTCVDEDITLSVTDEGTVFGYVWQKDAGNGFVDLSLAQYPTARNPILRIPGSTPAESGVYRCKVLGSASCGTAEVFSQEVVIKIWPYFSLDQQPESKTLCEGENSFIRINISGVVYSYQWYKDGVMITSKESPYYNKPVFYLTDSKFEDGGVYQCRVQAEDCFGFLDFMSEEASIYVSTGTEITVPPMTQAVVPGSDVTFRVRAHVNGTPEGYVPEVQWYKGNQPLVEGGRFIGTKSDRLSIARVSELDFGEDYRVVVTGHCGSDEASLFGLIKGVVTIVEQPVNTDACEDEAVILTVRAETTVPNGFLTYQWFKEGIAINDGNGITGTKTNQLVISPAKPNNSGNYYCLVKEGNSVTGMATVEASVTVSPKPRISSQPDANVTIETGGVLALTVEVEGIELEYQWYFDGAAIEGEDTNTLMIYDVKEENAGKYWVEITNNCGSVSSVVCDVIITTSNTDVKEVAAHGYSLGVAVPNPVNGSSNLEFSTPAESQVNITLVNSLGAEIAVLVNGVVAEGNHNITLNAEKLNLVSGIYSVVLKSNGVMLTQRVVVVR
ncbi:MAG: immunoglobulin domain-containing protein [Candidatus Kapabacteria bacterium]|nr:immunoglobulin domain-containing protein [Ignavibacteriota bacterium]MCW5885536.1 immunoglobulin domain-containing protein [Candidatus Kapabacteria bacterium]